MHLIWRSQHSSSDRCTISRCQDACSVVSSSRIARNAQMMTDKYELNHLETLILGTNTLINILKNVVGGKNAKVVFKVSRNQTLWTKRKKGCNKLALQKNSKFLLRLVHHVTQLEKSWECLRFEIECRIVWDKSKTIFPTHLDFDTRNKND